MQRPLELYTERRPLVPPGSSIAVRMSVPETIGCTVDLPAVTTAAEVVGDRPATRALGLAKALDHGVRSAADASSLLTRTGRLARLIGVGVRSRHEGSGVLDLSPHPFRIRLPPKLYTRSYSASENEPTCANENGPTLMKVFAAWAQCPGGGEWGQCRACWA